MAEGIRASSKEMAARAEYNGMSALVHGGARDVIEKRMPLLATWLAIRAYNIEFM